MTLHMGDIAPDFNADTQNVPISFHEWAGASWVFFFSHPAEFTPVCTTEMGRTAQLAGDFAARNVKPLGLSTDTADEHRSEEHTSELQSLMRISYAVFCLKKKKIITC